MKKKETMRSIFCGLAAGALFLGLLLGLDWNFLMAALLAAGLFEGLYLITKPQKIPLDMRPDGAYLEKRLEEAREDFESIRRSLEKIQDGDCGKNQKGFMTLLPTYWLIWKKIPIRFLWLGDL